MAMKKFVAVMVMNIMLLSSCSSVNKILDKGEAYFNNPCDGRNPAAEASKWQGPDHDPYLYKDTFTNTPVRAGVKLYTLYPYGSKTPNFFVKDDPILKNMTATEYHEALQVGHSGNSSKLKFPMRTQLAPFMVKKDTCMAMGKASANKQFGSGGGVQYYVEDRDKDNLERIDEVLSFK